MRAKRELCYTLRMDEKDLLNLSAKELTDLGVCPTCLNRKYPGAIFGDDADKRLYRDEDVEILFVAKPRAVGHLCILSVPHYHDMSEAPDALNEKIVRYAKFLMKTLCEVCGCERVYLCTMCDGPANHYHVQLIPRYAGEERGSLNFVKPRGEYRHDPRVVAAIRTKLEAFSKGQ